MLHTVCIDLPDILRHFPYRTLSKCLASVVNARMSHYVQSISSIRTESKMFNTEMHTAMPVYLAWLGFASVNKRTGIFAEPQNRRHPLNYNIMKMFR